MKQVATIAKREWLSLFFSPIGYVVLGLFALGTALLFAAQLEQGAAATMRPIFDGAVWLLIFIAPAVSMRLVAEELRLGTIERLMTTPVSDAAVATGKWIGAMGFMGVLLLPLGIEAIALEIIADPEPGPIWTGLLGLLLVGGLYLAIGLFASTLTSNQVIALLVTIAIISIPTFAAYFASTSAYLDPSIRKAVEYVSVNKQYADFAKGVIDIRNFVYFLSFTWLFVFLAAKMLEGRRTW